jgi:creatinine amidohydrolase
MIWENLREEEFEGAINESKGVCVMPVGCFEKHGQHLPVGTDILEGSYILHKAAEIEPVCVFPDFKFGDVQGLTEHKGAIRLTVELQQALMTKLCSEIARNGFKKILLFNSHGGNHAFLNNFIRSTQHDKKDYIVMKKTFAIGKANPNHMMALINEKGRSVFPELTDSDITMLQDYVDNKKYGGHGGFMETSAMLECYPELVRMDRIYADESLNTGKTKFLEDVGLNTSTRFWSRAFPNSYAGHPPEGCNERIAKAAVGLIIDDTVNTLKVFKNEEETLKWNARWNAAW